MVSAKIGNEYRYDFTAPKFRTAFEFLHRTDLAELPVGWIELGNGVRASVQHYDTAPAEQLKYETHEKFFDIQFLVDGIELLGCCSRTGLKEAGPYDADGDVTFYGDPEIDGSVLLRTGDYVIFAPEDAHKPRIAAGAPMAVKKIVIKVPV